MKKNKILIVVSLSALLILFSACDSPNEADTTTDEQSQTKQMSKESPDDSSVTVESSNSLSSNDSISTQKRENNNQASVYEDSNTGSEQNTITTEQNVDNGNTSVNEQDETEQTESNSIKISNGEEAVEHLKQNTEEGKNDDVIFGTEETLSTDDIGSYYTIRLSSLSLRLEGKTGTLETYKVYQDGTIDLW